MIAKWPANFYDTSLLYFRVDSVTRTKPRQKLFCACVMQHFRSFPGLSFFRRLPATETAPAVFEQPKLNKFMLTSPNFVCATVVFKHGARKVSCKRSRQGKSFSPWKDKSFETWILFDELSLSFSRVSFQRFAAMPLAQPRGPRQRWVCIGLLASRAKWHTPLIDCAWIKDYYPLIFVNSSLIHLEKKTMTISCGKLTIV